MRGSDEFLAADDHGVLEGGAVWGAEEAIGAVAVGLFKDPSLDQPLEVARHKAFVGADGLGHP